MSKEMWSQVKKFADGDNLDAETLNVPIGQLGERTAYLYSRLKELWASGKMSSVILMDVKLSTEEGRVPVVGNAVYLDTASGRFAAAKATMSLYDDFTTAQSAFTVGILQKKDGDSGNVLVYGSLDLNPTGSPILVRDMIESGESFRPGRYYLSANEAGKLTAHPNGPLIYVCTVSGTVVAGGLNGKAVVTPQFLDLGQSHIHRTAVLTARPAGTHDTTGYLPIDTTVDEGQVGPLALRFGGMFTAENPVDYKFWLDAETATWSDGVRLKWKEWINGGSITEQTAKTTEIRIYAPDVEVQVSNGLTVRLSAPASDSVHAYVGLRKEQREWGSLTFPDAGKGWIGHESTETARVESVDALSILTKSSFGENRTDVNIAFALKSDISNPGKITVGSKFKYGNSIYEFVSSKSSYVGENIPVDMGTCRADSCKFLSDEINKAENGVFCIFDPSYSKVIPDKSEDSVRIVILDGLQLLKYDEKLEEYVATTEGVVNGDDVGYKIPGTVAAFDVFNHEHVILSETPVVESAESCKWIVSGKISFLFYQTSNETLTIPIGTIASCTILDDAPDAVYDYVLGLDAQVANYWPPVPPKSAALLVNGIEMDNQALVPDHPTVAFGRRTIHWFADERGRRPWPEGFVSRDATLDPAYDKVEILHWVRGFQGATGPVTSLQVKPGSPLRLVGYGTEDAANTGDLEIEANLDFSIVAGGAPGFLVPKRTSGGKMIAGPVVERIVGGAGVNVISGAGCPDGQGTVVIALDNGAYVNQFTDIALENAEQAKIGMFPYLRLKGYTGSITTPSAFTATMRVPTNLPNMKYALKITASVFGENGFTGKAQQAACVKFSYNILPDFTAVDAMRYRDLKTSLLKPDSERTVLIPFGHAADGGIVYNGFDPLLISTEDESLTNEDDVVAKVLGKRIPHATDFALQKVIPELKPGYLVGVRFSRAVTPTDGLDAYTGAIGFINLAWSLVAAEDYGTAARPADDLFARNTSTGLYHAVVAVTDGETGRVDLGIDQQGVPRSK